MIPADAEVIMFVITCPHTRGDDPDRAIDRQVRGLLSPYAWG